MKRIGILSLFVFAGSVSADAQDRFHFTINPKQDTIVVYNAQDSVVLRYGKGVFTYRQTPVKMTKNKRKIIFSSPDGELGRVSSGKYRKIYLEDDSVYALAFGKRKLSYKKEGRVCAGAGYSFGGSYPYPAGKVDVEMSVDTDSNLIPFLFQSVLAHIQGTRNAFVIAWVSGLGGVETRCIASLHVYLARRRLCPMSSS
jgi:hypothetical protein